MDCAHLPKFLDAQLPADARARFERHLATCRDCQAEAEAAMQMSALGATLAELPDRPRAEPNAARRAARRRRAGVVAAALLGAALAAMLVLAVRASPATDDRIAANLAPRRAIQDRLPYPALDHYRPYDTLRAGPSRGGGPSGSTATGEPTAEVFPLEVVLDLEQRGRRAEMIAVLVARGELATADSELQRAGSGDDLDVERAVLARAPRHPQALWNRAIALAELDLPLAAAEAFDACAALAEPGWSAEAVARSAELRRRERVRADELAAAIETCAHLAEGAIPDDDFVRRHAALCRPSLYVAVRLARSRDAVLRLTPVARALDAAADDTATSALIARVAATNFAARASSIARYARLLAQPPPDRHDQERIVAQLRAAGQPDLLLGALLRVQEPVLGHHIAELVRLARASHDPYLDEIAAEYVARAQQASGRAIEAEASLRQAVDQCAARDVELRCAYLHIRLIELYLARHRPVEAADTARTALQRSRRVGLYWDERVLFGYLGKVGQLERDHAQMRAYIREASLRANECMQVSIDQASLASAELAELRFAGARRELDRAGACNEPLSLQRAAIEAELARVDGTPARLAQLLGELAQLRHEAGLTAGELAHLDAIEGRILATRDPGAARAVLMHAIEAAAALGYDDVDGAKARSLAYRTLLVLGAEDLDRGEVLALFAAAARARPRPGCALGALVDGERLLLVARDAAGHAAQVFEPHRFTTPDLDVRGLVPPALLSVVASCARVDVFALPPLYGQHDLLPAALAWSYRGPAGEPARAAAARGSVLIVEDARPPAVLDLPRLEAAPRTPRTGAVREVILRGAEATPSRVQDELRHADFAEFHAHGFVDLGISDASLIALSPDVDGGFALTARVIAGRKLPRAPFITLAACDAAYTAPYLHEPWSLPYAFLLAGARGVLAPATQIPDTEAEPLFRSFEQRVLAGDDPAVILRDQRLARGADAARWIDRIVVFD